MEVVLGAAASPDRCILVADDNADQRGYVSRLLSPRWTVETVADGQADFEATRRLQPDLVLSDVMMPGMDGFALRRTLRSHPETQSILVILLPDRAGEAARVQGLERFAFVASHDLQEPLRKIEPFGRLIGETAGPRLGEAERDDLERMQQAAGRLRNTISDLLTLSRITSAGKPFLPVDLNRVMDDLEVRLKQTRGQVLLGDLPIVQADPLQMHQLFQNLIGNGLKFHQPDVPPVVSIRSTRLADHRVAITVEDNGVGFEQGQASRLFQPFQRLHGRSEFEGTGIGLSICYKIVERHGGTIEARGEVGKGASFTAVLPAGAARP